MMLKKILVIGFVALQSGLLACDCMPLRAQEQIMLSDAVFVGRLLEVNTEASRIIGIRGNAIQNMKFEVIRYFNLKDRMKQVVTVFTETSNCEFKFDKSNVGDTFIMFVDRLGGTSYNQPSFWTSSGCRGNQFFSGPKDREMEYYLNLPAYWDSTVRYLDIQLPDSVLSNKKEKIIEKKEKEVSGNMMLYLLLCVNLILTVYILLKIRSIQK